MARPSLGSVQRLPLLHNSSAPASFDLFMEKKCGENEGQSMKKKIALKMTFSAFVFVALAWSNLGWSAQDPDLVLPSKDDGAEQDAIVKEKLENEDVSDQDAQDRKIPKSEQNYTRIVPFGLDNKEPP